MSPYSEVLRAQVLNQTPSSFWILLHFCNDTGLLAVNIAHYRLTVSHLPFGKVALFSH